MQSENLFETAFRNLTGFLPMLWQRRLYEDFLSGALPSALDLPTGLGKTAVMAVWYLALQAGALLPRRLVYVVDRRVVVDQATTVADRIREATGNTLPVSTLRGQHVDNRDWLADPSGPAIIVGTVDMIGSRLLFSGYGVSRRMRPFHAGLLGADALVVLDESHLVPPFEALLEAIESGDGWRPRDLVPPFRLLSLSATGRARPGRVFRLDAADLEEAIVRERLEAPKTLTIAPLDGRKLDEALAEQAWALTGDDVRPLRCLVYCNSRDIAEKTHALLSKKKGAEVEVLVGARRVKERQDAEQRFKDLGFLADATTERSGPAFLVATSAGEVGIDLDADVLVCDTVAWERMVQRLGRVNRRGKGSARVVVIAQDADHATLAVIRALPPQDDGFDASPGALRALKLRAEREPSLQVLLDTATTPVPLRPALSRPMVEAWSLTSLAVHTGRPEVQPWLRGWETDDQPQTAVVWRRFLPLRDGVSNREVVDFFEAVPPHASEVLETETGRVAEWLVKRAAAQRGLHAFVLSPAGELLKVLTARDIADLTKRSREPLERSLARATLVVGADIGGFRDGLLDSESDIRPPTADGDWLPLVEGQPVVPFRVRSVSADQTGEMNDDWRERFRFAAETSGDAVTRWLILEKWRQDTATGNDRSVGRRAQELADHHGWTEERARDLATALRLPADLAAALCLAARLHDAGKAAARWQRAFNAPRDGKTYAKTKGPLFPSLLDGYRHEFGSLPLVEQDAAAQALPPDLRDLVLHLVAAHHGEARPVISTRSCDDAPPSALEQRAAEVALRFVRLQAQWGPWGLAWWETLLRAADHHASARNDEVQ